MPARRPAIRLCAPTHEPTRPPSTHHNASAAVSVPFHQIMRSTCPVFTVALHRLLFGRTYPRATYLSLIPVVAGVALATYGDYHYTRAGFWLTLLGVVLASVKVRLAAVPIPRTTLIPPDRQSSPTAS